MSKKFWAINRQTGDRRKPVRGEYLVMYDSGYLAVVGDSDWEGQFVAHLNPKEWECVHKFKERK